MSRRHRTTLRSMSDMNLTPMMDLTFLLLITFIITFPLIEQGIPVNLPSGKTQVLEADDKPAVVSVDKEGRIFLGVEPLTLEGLEQRLKIMLAENQDLRITLRGDADVNYGAIVAVARMATSIGIKKMSMATQE